MGSVCCVIAATFLRRRAPRTKDLSPDQKLPDPLPAGHRGIFIFHENYYRQFVGAWRAGLYRGARSGVCPRLERKINAPAAFTCKLVGSSHEFEVPVAGARVAVLKAGGEFLFTGYLTQQPEFEFLGWGESGPVHRYGLIAESDEVLLNQKALPNRAPFIARSAGSALKQLVEDLLPGQFDTAEVEDIDTLAHYQVNPQKKFSEHAGEIALAARASYRVMDRKLTLSPVGAETYAISENDPNFSPRGLKVACPTASVNDVTVIGLDEPQAYVRDYFVGDGFSSRFYLSQQPFQQNRRALINEKYLALDATTWKVSDVGAAISVGAQALQINGGSGRDGESTISFVEQIELGGALELQHGDVSFTAPSRGVIGGLYAGQVSTAGCLAGFQITPSGSASSIQALLNGSATGAMITTTAGHRYLLTTYVYSMEVYRSSETYHSSVNVYGGTAVAGNVRIVLQVQDINPSVPSSMLAPATVLYDGVISNAPGFCAYALVNAVNMQCSIAGTYVRHISTAEVRSALPDQGYETRLVESLSDGGECAIVGSGTLDFYPQYVPPLDTLVVVSYRGVGAGVAEVVNEGDRVRLENGADDGVRSSGGRIKAPRARTQVDCENAAMAILEDAGAPGMDRRL